MKIAAIILALSLSACAQVTLSGGSATSVSAGTKQALSGPLRVCSGNAHWMCDKNGKAVGLFGAHTWSTMQDTSEASPSGSFLWCCGSTSYIGYLTAHGMNTTILWHKDLPKYCSWGGDGGGKNWFMGPYWPWQRSATSGEGDGGNKFDLTLFDQNYFDRLRLRALQAQQAGIYVVVEFFDGLGVADNPCVPNADPLASGNNINSVDDGGGTGAYTMLATNAVTAKQVAYMQKVVDTLNDLDNVIWEISEEAPNGSSTFWQGYMLGQLQTYEAGKAKQHPVLYPTLDVEHSVCSETTITNSNADIIAPSVSSTLCSGDAHAPATAKVANTSYSGTGSPAQKVVLNDSDHSYFGMWNDSKQTNRNILWENFTNAASYVWMDPYNINWPSTPTRNNCGTATNGICAVGSVDTQWNGYRDNLGRAAHYASIMDLAKMTPQGSLASTGWCLAQNVAVGGEFLIYVPTHVTSITVDLHLQSGRTFNYEWWNPNTLAVDGSGTYTATSSTAQTFTLPAATTADAVLYLVDSAGAN